MKMRHFGAGLAVLVSSLCVAATSALAHEAGAGAPAAEEKGACTVKSLPSFVLQGEFDTAASAADVVEVSCDPFVYGTGSTVQVVASQLYSRCQGHLDWFIPNPYQEIAGSRSVEVTLDADGNANVALLAGGGCQAGESLITVHELEEPFESFTTAYSVLPPNETEEGVFAMPSSQVEDAESSGVATIIEAEFAEGSEKFLRIGAEELYSRCRAAPHMHLIDESGVDTLGAELTGTQLDNDGNAFVIAIGDASCFPGTSLVEADLESKPFTTLATDFTVLSPRPRN